jgi:hypothetical protein
MKLVGVRLRQRDGVTCGPTVAVVAGALLNPAYRNRVLASDAHAFEEQARVHAEVNRVWPRRLGTTPPGMARALNEHSAVRYRWRRFRGRRDKLSDVLSAVDAGWPVALLIGSVIPRHWVLIADADGGVLQCYEPSSGELRPVEVDAVRASRLVGLGFPRPFAFVLPREATRPET